MIKRFNMRALIGGILVHCCLGLTGFVIAAQLPADLMYLAKPVDPLCLFQIESKEAEIDLSKCGFNSQEVHPSGANKKLVSEGFVGYDYDLKIDDSKHLKGYSYYKVIANMGNAYLIQTINNSGGTGSFSFLNVIQREGDILHLSVLDGGDRCNGGLVDLKKEGKGAHARLVYSVYLTPYDFLTVAKDNPNHVKAYDDLSACASCCAAKAVFERDIGQNFEQRRLQYLDVSMYVKDIANTAHNEPYQHCFNQLLVEQVKKEPLQKLDANDLLRFTHAFNTRCVRKIAQF